MLPRVLEPEVMDTEAEAREYDAMDFTDVNRAFVIDFRRVWDTSTPVLDVCTGTARILLLAHMDTVYPREMLTQQPFRVDGTRAPEGRGRDPGSRVALPPHLRYRFLLRGDGRVM